MDPRKLLTEAPIAKVIAMIVQRQDDEDTVERRLIISRLPDLGRRGVIIPKNPMLVSFFVRMYRMKQRP
jgi:hypothetical protein